MPRREDIEKVLLIGSGPIEIGQAAEFDYSGSQACAALWEVGVKVVLVNSNPATIMTDPEMADAVYVEPLTAETVAEIIKKERPDGIVAGLGGQTALNATSELAEMGVLEEYDVEVLGTPIEAIENTENRDKFKKKMEEIGEKVPRSKAVCSLEEAKAVVEELGFPVIIRPAYTLGGTGGGVAKSMGELEEIVERGLKRSRIGQVLVEESVLGWTELEYEVMRDSSDTCITVVNMENFDPMGIHTGESIVVAPSQTLSDVEHQMLRTAAIKIIRALGVEGGCNIQFALNRETGEYTVVEVNPRVSRSSALASKATGYPIARIAAKIAVGLNLFEIPNQVTKETPASFEPTVDYVVVKIPRWPFDKFHGVDRKLTTQMKSTGEVMAIGRTLEEAFQKAIRSLDIGQMGFSPERREERTSPEEIEKLLKEPTDERIFAIYDGLKIGFTIDKIKKLTSIDPFFIQKIKNILDMEEEIKKAKKLTFEYLKKWKQNGFTDEQIAKLRGTNRENIADLRRKLGIKPTYKMVDTCAAEFEAKTPYFYSTWEEECEVEPSDRKKILILGAGPIRIGQGIEFDYSSVHAVQALREESIETLLLNNNPETVSTDYDTSDRLYFEPLTLEDVVNVIEREVPYGVIVQAGGQTSVNLAVPLQKELERRDDLDTKILGTSPDRIDMAEDRNRFKSMLEDLGIPQPESGIAKSKEEAKKVAERIGYPLLVRPSYVLGGRAMEIVHDEQGLERFIEEAVRVSPDHPILIDEFLEGATEIDVDAVADGDNVFIGAIMEHIEEAGVHSGDSACVIPPQSIGVEELEQTRRYVENIGRRLKVVGFLNIQIAVKNGKVYVLEANPRSSRTIPYVSKAVGTQLAKIAAKLMIGHSLKGIGYLKSPLPKHVAVKEVVLPFDKLPGVDPVLGPEMKSTGEVMGIDSDFGRAFYKAELAAGNCLPEDGSNGTVFLSVRDQDKLELLPLSKKLSELGLDLMATPGTADYLRSHGLTVESVKKVSEGNPNIIDKIREGRKVSLIINTPSSGKQPRRDGYEIRRIAVDLKIPYMTTIQAAKAAAQSIGISGGRISISPLNRRQKDRVKNHFKT